MTLEENFDSLLVPKDHVSRSKNDCYYINRDYLLRAHTTAHQSELIRMGLDNFVVFGDVYRRDQIDSTHFPVFHQADGVHLLNQEQVCKNHFYSFFSILLYFIFERLFPIFLIAYYFNLYLNYIMANLNNELNNRQNFNTRFQGTHCLGVSPQELVVLSFPCIITDINSSP